MTIPIRLRRPLRQPSCLLQELAQTMGRKAYYWHKAADGVPLRKRGRQGYIATPCFEIKGTEGLNFNPFVPIFKLRPDLGRDYRFIHIAKSAEMRSARNRKPPLTRF